MHGVPQKIYVKQRVQRPHRNLHDEVFPDGVVATPSGTVIVRERNPSRPEVPPRPLGARARTGSISGRPISTAGPPQTFGLPPRPNFRLSTYNESSSDTNASPSSLLRTGTAPAPRSSAMTSTAAPLRRTLSSASATPARTSSLRNPGLAPVAEGSSLDRSASMDRRPPQSQESRPVPMKRNSVVLQRIKAFEDVEDSSRFSRTLKEFPLPPPPPPSGGLPPVPRQSRW
ncbi:hypothetical protein BDP27DRAFT_1321864 [Rhodocollybia butyracea]|uniref:Uncharacterized protein n=1 Tax=Rhodocollybia butyracea TaxID=206335 RepID=A0A9P5UA72_9AGAR|nr:hypothetical protein BDP27DRAFT_1321864 [Rhodocollybia butyracea]